MRTCLIFIFVFVSTAQAEEGPIYWQYPGPFAERLEAAFSAVKTKRESHHLISEADRRQFLIKQIKRPMRENCLEDRTTCASEALGVLDALGMKGRIIARAKRTEFGYEITLILESLKHKSVRTITAGASGPISQAASEVLKLLHGQGTLSLNITPKDAFFFLNDIPYGQGSGDHLVTTGEHSLRVEAPGFKPESMPLSVKTGERVRVRVELAPAAAILSLETIPKGAEVFLDGERWQTPQEERSLVAGKRLLRVQKEGYETFEQTLTLKPSSISNLKLTLAPSDPPWRRALKSTVSDTTQMPFFVRGSLSVVSLRDRELDLSTNVNPPGRLDGIYEPMSGQTFGFALSMRKDSMLIDCLRVDYTTAKGPVLASTRPGSELRVTDISRLTLAPVWVGYQYEIWRLVPYAMGGVSFAIETVNGELGESRFNGDHTEFKIGGELGLRYVFSPELFVGLTHHVEGFPGVGTHLGFGLHLGYAFDLPQKVKDMLP